MVAHGKMVGAARGLLHRRDSPDQRATDLDSSSDKIFFTWFTTNPSDYSSCFWYVVVIERNPYIVERGFANGGHLS